ncbi:MAG: DHH family phosphoesterase [Clostridiales Family XIII bacterium]|jgi:manganese-dependent inorganic pyrophosphatase|nr:DHH family phosphoesterase [Clostridiales Family XIII bacterium]
MANDGKTLERIHRRAPAEADRGRCSAPRGPYDPEGGHTKEEADAEYEKLFRELHGVPGEKAPGKRETHETAVLGGRDPCTDAVCSAIAYANLKNRISPESRHLAYRAGNLDAEARRVLGMFGVATPPEIGDLRNRRVILVDHNAQAEAAEGIEEAIVTEIIDHHRLGGITTRDPVYFRGEPVGATSTIVYRIYKEHGELPDRTDAGLLCSGIVSATRLFSSHATVGDDRLAAVELANIAGLDLQAHATAMFWGNTEDFG